MTPRDEKAQSIHWDNPVGSNEERTSFKKKKKFVYLDKYEDTVGEMREDIVSLEKRQPSEIMKVLYSIFNPNFSMQVKKCIINDMRDICKILYLSNGSTEAFKKYLNDGAPVRSLNASHGLPEIILL